MDFQFLQDLIVPAQTKIAMIIMDGLGGLPLEPGGKTELETARTPNLDALAAQSALGLTMPVGPGITVESGPGHLSIFGYDPIQYRIGRGMLEAVGIDFELGPNDVAARGNFCAMDAAGVVTDRRAGRISTQASRELAKLLTTKIDDVEFFVETVKEHLQLLALRAANPLERLVSEVEHIKYRCRPCFVSLDPESSVYSVTMLDSAPIYCKDTTELMKSLTRINHIGCPVHFESHAIPPQKEVM